MALIVKDRVRETSVTSGTGTLTLQGPVPGYQGFSAIGNGNTTYYCIAGSVDWEVGLGTVSGSTLQRTSVLASSNNGSLVNFTSEVKQVFVTQPSSQFAPISTLIQPSNNPGTSGQQLLSQGAGLPAQWANRTGWVFEATSNANNSPQLVATNLDFATRDYAIDLRGLSSSFGTVSLYAQVSSTNGVGFISNPVYNWSYYSYPIAANYSNSSNAFVLTANAVTAFAQSYVSGTLIFSLYSSSTFGMYGVYQLRESGGVTSSSIVAGSYSGTVPTINALRVFFSSGNILSGGINVYSIRRTA